MENPFEEEQESGKRPALLTVLCILTFIGTAFSILSALVLSFMPDTFSASMQDQFAQMVGEEQAEGMVAAMVSGMRSAPYLLVLYIINLFGAIQMFRLRKMGFFIYVAAQVLIWIFPVIMGGPAASLIMSGIWTALFIILYAINLKFMK